MSRCQAVQRYGIQVFRARGRQLVAETPIFVDDARQARQKCETLARHVPGVIAYRIDGDPELGDVEEPVLLARHGRVPPQIEDMSLDEAA